MSGSDHSDHSGSKSRGASYACLVIAPQWIGDAVMTEPLLSKLQQQGAHICVAATHWVAPVYRVMTAVAQVIELPFGHGAIEWRARWRFARALAGRFDVAYVLPNSFKSALIPWMAGIKVRIGYVGEMRYGWLNRWRKNPSQPRRVSNASAGGTADTFLPMVQFYSALATPNSELGEPVHPQLKVSEALLESTLKHYGLQRQGYVVLAPGAEFGTAKRWPAQHFRALSSAINAPAAILGSTKEHALAAQVALQHKDVNLAGSTTLEQALAIVAAAAAVVSNDSGLMHVAAALSVPQVALFGPTSPRHTPPLSPRARALWLKDAAGYAPALDCAPCFQRQCPLGHARCLSDIGPEQVLQSLELVGLSARFFKSDQFLSREQREPHGR